MEITQVQKHKKIITYQKVGDFFCVKNWLRFALENWVNEIRLRIALIQEEAEKERKMVRMVLDIKEKFGKNAILRGIDYDERATQRERNEQIGGHRGGES